MAVIHFYEKPGCINNGKQKALLIASGHTLIEYDITRCELTGKELRQFFGALPISEWFNYTAPAIKNGQIDPSLLSEEKALEAMLDDRLLIRRPLLQIGNDRLCGFDRNVVASYITMEPVEGREAEFEKYQREDIVTCPNIDKKSCQD